MWLENCLLKRLRCDSEPINLCSRSQQRNVVVQESSVGDYAGSDSTDWQGFQECNSSRTLLARIEKGRNMGGRRAPRQGLWMLEPGRQSCHGVKGQDHCPRSQGGRSTEQQKSVRRPWSIKQAFLFRGEGGMGVGSQICPRLLPSTWKNWHNLIHLCRLYFLKSL